MAPMWLKIIENMSFRQIEWFLISGLGQHLLSDIIISLVFSIRSAQQVPVNTTYNVCANASILLLVSSASVQVSHSCGNMEIINVLYN